MRVRRQDGLELGWFATQLTPGELSAVFVVKATYRIGEHALELVEQDAAPVSGDVEAEEGRGGLTYATDFVPYKPKADVLLRAHAYAPAPKRQGQTGTPSAGPDRSARPPRCSGV